jgi:hypothetical protein
MTTAHESDLNSSDMARRSRLTLDLDPELHLRIKIAAAHARLSMREYLEQMLREIVPPLPSQGRLQGRPISPDVLEMLRRTREEVSGGRILPDSTEIVRRMRDEQATGGSEP